jgi:hypothetical protein
MPSLGLAMEALRSPAMALIEPSVFLGPTVTTATGPEQGGIIMTDDDGFINPSL